jgi:hypothetical protein
MYKNAVWRCQNAKKWQHSTDAENLSERGEDHQNKQQPELPAPSRVDVVPEAAKELADSLGGMHGN